MCVGDVSKMALPDSLEDLNFTGCGGITGWSKRKEEMRDLRPTAQAACVLLLFLTHFGVFGSAVVLHVGDVSKMALPASMQALVLNDTRVSGACEASHEEEGSADPPHERHASSFYF